MKKSILLALIFFCTISAIAQKPPKVVKEPVKCGVPVANYLTRGIDTSASRGVADNYYLWDNHSTIVVKFMPGGSQRLRNLVMQYAKEWEQYANIKFSFVPDNAAATNIRVKLGNGLGHNSYVGIQCNLHSQAEQTINLDTADFVDYRYYADEAARSGVDVRKMTENEWKAWLESVLQKPNLKLDNKGMHGTTLHEFGHALGLLHEQSYPGAIKWNRSDDVYAYYLKTQGWDKQKVDAQVFEVSAVFYTNGTTYDPKSIMQYPIEAWQTTDGFTVPNNTELSEGDKKLIAALYPKDKAVSDREVPRVNVTSLTNVEVINNPTKNGLSIYPSFVINSNSKVCPVYFVARLYDEDGKYLPDNNDKYNYGGYVATYVKGTLTPNSRASFNKGSVKNLELFLPYDEIPDLNGRRVNVEFTVILDDVQNGQFKKVIYYLTNKPVSVKKSK